MKTASFCILILVFLLIANLSMAQETSEKKFKYGFNLGVQYTHQQVHFKPMSGPFAARISNGAGFQLGLNAEYRISHHFSFYSGAGLSFNNNSLSLIFPDGSGEIYDVYPVLLGFDAGIKYKTGKSDTKPYLFLGPGYKLPIPDPESNANQILRPNLCAEFGVGLDKPFKKFVFSPELKYSYGLSNITGPTDYIQHMQFHTISLVFKFS